MTTPARLLVGGALSLSLVVVAACDRPAVDDGARPAPTLAPTTTAPPPTSEVPDPTGPDEAETTTSPVPEEEAGPQLGAYGVSAGHPLAAEAGTRVLEAGGNAVDAAIAAAFTDSVVHPPTSGIGGGGAAIVLTEDVADSYDYREVVAADGTVPADHVGTPGFVAGMARLHQDHGSVPWDELLRPALDAARDGVPVSAFLASTLALPSGQGATSGLEHFRRADGTVLLEGDVLVQEDLARTLSVLAEDGPEAFVSGSLADRLLQEPGLDAETLTGYEVQVLPAPAGPVGDHTMLSAAPALPGAALIQLVQVAEAAGIGEVAPYSPDFVDLQSQAWGVAETSAHTVLGDPAFVDVPVDRLTDAEVNASLADQLVAAGQHAAGVGEVAGGPGGTAGELGGGKASSTAYQGSGNTTHISVVDADGRAVSMTNTITYFWGSGRYVDGYFLNNHLERFTAIGTTDANDPAPGRRSVSWSAPSMLLDAEGRPVLVLGTPGGQHIPNTVAGAVLRWSLHEEDLPDLVAAPRFLHVGGELILESPELAGPMQERGYAVHVLDSSRRGEFGSLQALEVDWEEGTVTSSADDRRSGGFSLGVAEEP